VKRGPGPAKTRSLQVRLALLVTFITSPALLLLGFLSLLAADRAVSRTLEDRGQRVAELLDDTFANMELRGDPGPIQREIERLTRVRSGVRDVYVFAWDDDSKYLSSFAARAKVVAFAPTPSDQRAAEQDRFQFRREENDLSAPLHREGKVVGVVRAELAPIESGGELVADARLYLALAALGALGLTGVALVWALDRAIGRPVEQLVGVMERARQGDLNVEVPVTHLDEFGWLGENFNRMLRKLREKDESLARWNAELEQKVAAATIELAKKNEELARANHRLFEAQRALGNSERLASLGQLASQLAHEIGTPLNSIYGHIQLLAADEIPDEAKKRVAIVESQVERLTKIIENVLRTLRLPEAQLAEVDVNPLLAGVAAFMQPVAESRKIRLELDLAARLPQVYVDQQQIEQVLLNLITNSIDAMPGGGTLRIESSMGVPEIANPLTASSSGEAKALPRDASEIVLLRVRDTGVGIPTENLHRIFEPFFTTKAKGSGTGLGLPICQQILRAFRGTLAVESEGPGKGSCFTVKLPAIRKAEPGPESSDARISDSDARGDADARGSDSDTRTTDSSANLNDSARLAPPGGV
jgi:signal transduction histidine kinase